MVKKWSEVKGSRLSPERVKAADAKGEALAAELTLAQLREAAGKTQIEVAELTEQTQGELSRFERRDDRRISTLRRYVEALGGELEVVAIVNGKRVPLAV
ncbi:MAG: helix-turn-helix transcriptional regulator [Polyangiales bacterium]